MGHAYRARYEQLRREVPTVGALPALFRRCGYNADFIDPPPSGSSGDFAAPRLGWRLGTVGSHLAVLRDAGLVTRTRAGRAVRYAHTPLGAALAEQLNAAGRPTAADHGAICAPGCSAYFSVSVARLASSAS